MLLLLLQLCRGVQETILLLLLTLRRSDAENGVALLLLSWFGRFEPISRPRRHGSRGTPIGPSSIRLAQNHVVHSWCCFCCCCCYRGMGCCYRRCFVWSCHSYFTARHPLNRETLLALRWKTPDDIRLSGTMRQNQVILRRQKFTFPRGSGASERANGRASGPVLTPLFLFVPDHSAPSPPSRPFNVYVLGFDSTSRSQSVRHLRKVRSYLLSPEIDAIEYYAYNKVGPNTWPNFAPMHTGWHEETPGND